MTAKEYLQQAADLDAQIESYIQEKDNLRRMACSIRSPQMGGQVQTSREPDAAFVRVLEKIEAVEETIVQKIDQLVDLKVEMSAAINTLEDPKERLVLQYRYINCQRFEDIANAMHTSLSSIYRLHASALKKLEIPAN
ncbi:MAG: DUF1492 domain-containing protein [Clostridiales bacterium]|nr:DUF1492 domain-containing protein [Clostridiales bacterium]